MSPIPMMNSSVTSSAQRVDRTERSLVHSESATRRWVTRPTWTVGVAAAVSAVATLMPASRSPGRPGSPHRCGTPANRVSAP